LEPTADFVESLALEVLGSDRLWCRGSSGALADLGSQPRSAYVVAASVVSFAEGVTGQQKEDLLNSTLLARISQTSIWIACRFSAFEPEIKVLQPFDL
jgi:hypothetical protein